MTTCWRVDDGVQSLVLAVLPGPLDLRMAEIVYWGAPLPREEDLEALAAAARSDLTGGSLDATIPAGICPSPGASFPGQPGLWIADAAGKPLAPALRFAHAERDGAALVLHHVDTMLGLRHAARIEPEEGSGVLRLSATLESDTPMRLAWLSAPVLPGPQCGTEIVDFHGTWLREFHRNRTPWSAGIRMREARTGRSGHEHFPAVLLPCRGATKTAGEVFALQLAWSGGHRMLAEELADGRRQVQIGKSFGAASAPATRFESGLALAAYSAEGEAGIARAHQRLLRDRLVPWPDPGRPRPVHYNCWEAIYFDQSADALIAIADRAAALGAERFVLDDGWFGGTAQGRDDDTTSLGDWQVDRRKWPGGLAPLIDHVTGLGMSFGLWVEPEMVNLDSDLYRANPDWLLGPAMQVPGRGQYLLDMARPEVRAHLLEAIGALLRAHPIDYLKWDHNRVLPHVDPAQTDGIYDLLDRLRAAHPGVEIESCASGGGRIDAGILSRTHRVWLSDSNDAIERLRMQHEAALFLPAAVTGSHVGPRASHSSGRILSIAFRGWVAAQRHMGFEMDPRELDAGEMDVLRRITDWYKANRDWMHRGRILPLDSADPALTAEQQIAADGGRFVLFAGTWASMAQSLPRPLRLAGLDPYAFYRLRLVNPEDLPPQSRGPLALKDGPVTLSGRALMSQGLRLPWAWPGTMWTVEGVRL
ncbi:alpha-galactosidase [Profundibacterium mesophilum]|uniref:alpha-galactosidase n=1 Tax=Profundibacterium mesophilum KAUST100406-0324 TaxID=1037889 RepID=A0A921NPF3_9RHOB|nr:alpha-galactosidase [Profundibacterium mesophilum]KAF0674570.1 alpha-galactosidase [Profundibacterium mesophilum KAUST100406-0324]